MPANAGMLPIEHRLGGMMGLPLALCLCTASLVLPTAVAAPAPSDVRVMTFNIRYGTAQDGENAWPHRRDLLFETIRRAAPDILGVQEALAFQLDEIQGALPRYQRVGVGRDDGKEAGEYSAILIDRGRFEILGQGTFWFSDTPSEPGSMDWGNRIPRICTWVHVMDRRVGRAFYVYNLHWDHESQASRERSAALLVREIGRRDVTTDPVVVTGDFNAGEANPAFRYLVTHGLTDSFRALHPSASGVGTFNGFSGDREGEKIDAVLVSTGWTVAEASILYATRDGRYPSDHFPVTAVLRLAQ